ncbi:hypothetical protein Bache_2461 [Bacteroides helcogenes P 36-108]|uniref:Uncharacterized protein n=1 Tax=Bacteroides helcogenes (strain ATCC 35417 / DSM 20613 / JCM 6297 / CCUG 15421 / P 36-108) TaxID=693979 RepID=E6SUT1_BACT6|nr:hypothetical protein Bache_2461 [Bacteroides helcogenes P 36-108]
MDLRVFLEKLHDMRKREEGCPLNERLLDDFRL